MLYRSLALDNLRLNSGSYLACSIGILDSLLHFHVLLLIHNDVWAASELVCCGSGSLGSIHRWSSIHYLWLNLNSHLRILNSLLISTKWASTRPVQNLLLALLQSLTSRNTRLTNLSTIFNQYNFSFLFHNISRPRDLLNKMLGLHPSSRALASTDFSSILPLARYFGWNLHKRSSFVTLSLADFHRLGGMMLVSTARVPSASTLVVFVHWVSEVLHAFLRNKLVLLSSGSGVCSYWGGDPSTTRLPSSCHLLRVRRSLLRSHRHCNISHRGCPRMSTGLLNRLNGCRALLQKLGLLHPLLLLLLLYMKINEYNTPSLSHMVLDTAHSQDQIILTCYYYAIYYCAPF